MGQALAASTQCVQDAKELHSLHSYFLKGGDPEMPILYRVKRLNTTNNFEMHSISAKQNGQIIFSCQASYHRREQYSLFHERPMSEAPDPETLPSQEDNLLGLLDDPRLPSNRRAVILESLKTPFAIDVREVTPLNYFKSEKRAPGKLVWMRTRLPLPPDDSNLHRCFAAFASDWGLGSASLLPHGIFFGHPQLKVSLKYTDCNSIWYLLYVY